MGDYCYWCSGPATSREHVPPKCLFPTDKDIEDSAQYRENLITVPSCDDHNGAKSHDDEYLLCVLAISILNNDIGTKQAVSKVIRALKRSPKLAAEVLQDPMAVTAEKIESGELQKTVAFKLDNARVSNVFEHIARALFFHHYGQNWEGTISSFAEFQMALGSDDDRDKNARYEKIRSEADKLMESAEHHGENPEVFFYQMVDQMENFGLLMLRLTFYEGARVLIKFGDVDA